MVETAGGDGATVIRSSIVSSQHEFHAVFGGVVPEVASRRHTELLVPTVADALADAGVGWDDLDGVAVTTGPGLIGALLIGLAAAKAIAYARRLPLTPVDHLQGHLAASRRPTRSASRRRSSVSRPAAVTRCSRSSSAASSSGWSGARSTTPPARPSTRAPGCSACPTRAAASWTCWRPAATPPSWLSAQPAAGLRLQLQRPQDGPALLPARPGGADGTMAVDRRSGRRPTQGQTMRGVPAPTRRPIVDQLVSKTVRCAEQEGLRRVAVGGGVAANSRLRRRLAPTPASSAASKSSAAARAVHRQRGHGRPGGAYLPSAWPHYLRLDAYASARRRRRRAPRGPPGAPRRRAPGPRRAPLVGRRLRDGHPSSACARPDSGRLPRAADGRAAFVACAWRTRASSTSSASPARRPST